MRRLTEIGIEAKQVFNLTGENNQFIRLNLRYLPSQEAWFMDVSFQSVTINNIAVVNSPNLLHNYENVLPFGILCNVQDRRDPYFIDDFEQGRAFLALLTTAEVQQVAEALR